MNRAFLACSVVFFLVGVESNVFGQQAPQTPSVQADSSLAEIVVTAQRRAERLQDVPMSATVTSGASLEQANIVSLQDLSTRLPNIKIAQATVDSISIRGVGSGSNAGFEQDVGTFVDGVYRGRARAVRASLFDVEQLEVLKGPQSTFFGNNTIAGALNISTRKPGDTFDYNASALYGSSIGEYSIEGAVTAPISNTLSVRVAAEAFGQNGWVDNEVLRQNGPHDRDWVGRVSLAWRPSEIWRTDLRVDHDHKRANDLGGELLGCPPRPQYGAAVGYCAFTLANNGGFNETDINSRTFSTEPTYENYDMTEVAVTNRLDLTKFTLTAISSYFTHTDELAPVIGPFDAPGVLGASTPTPASFDEHYYQVAQEIRIASPTGQFLSWMGGLYFAHGGLDQPSYFGFYFAPFGPAPLAATIPFEQHDTTWSGFGALNFHFTDQFRLNAGLRYSVVDKTAHSRSDFGTGGVPINANSYISGGPVFNHFVGPFFGADLGDFANPERRDSKLMPSVSFQYEPFRDLMAYASYTNGFKAGGFGVSFTRNEFAPEKVNAYEVGLKTTLLDHRLSLAVAGFLSDYQDVQETTNQVLPGGALLSIITNAAAARSKGVELSADYKFNQFLIISANVASLSSKYRSYPNAPCTILQSEAPGCIQDLSGQTRGFAPDYSGSLSARITVPLANSLAVHIEPAGYFTTKYYESATHDPLLAQGGYAKLDLRTGIGSSDGRWEIAMVAKNLTDKRTAGSSNSVVAAGTAVSSYPDPPRTIAVQFSVKH